MKWAYGARKTSDRSQKLEIKSLITTIHFTLIPRPWLESELSLTLVGAAVVYETTTIWHSISQTLASPRLKAWFTRSFSSTVQAPGTLSPEPPVSPEPTPTARSRGW